VNSDEKLNELQVLSNRGHSVLVEISQQINGQGILGLAELIGKALTLEFDPVERELLWQAGGILKKSLPDPVERVLVLYVGWYMDCKFLFSELKWDSSPHVQNFLSARAELATELQRSQPSLQIVLKIVERQVTLLKELCTDPPSVISPEDEEMTQDASSQSRGGVIAVYILMCYWVDLLLVIVGPLDLLLWVIGTEIAILSVAIGVWKFILVEK
jgi:hypothetical protein